MPRNESQYKISSETYLDFPFYFHLYFKIRHFFHIPQFWRKKIFWFVSRHFISLYRYGLWKVMPKIREPASNNFNEMKLKIQEIILINWIFIWGINFHNLKYLVKPINCLEMRAKKKSVRKINKIFFCIFTYIWKSDIFSTYLNFDEKWFFGHFKSQISKCPTYIKLLVPVSYVCV